MKIDRRGTKETNLSLVLDFLSFLIELRYFFFVCPAKEHLSNHSNILLSKNIDLYS